MEISLKKKFIFHTLKSHTDQQYIFKHFIIFNSCLIELKIRAFEIIVWSFKLWIISFLKSAEKSNEKKNSESWLRR